MEKTNGTLYIEKDLKKWGTGIRGKRGGKQCVKTSMLQQVR